MLNEGISIKAKCMYGDKRLCKLSRCMHALLHLGMGPVSQEMLHRPKYYGNTTKGNPQLYWVEQPLTIINIRIGTDMPEQAV